MQSVLGYTRRAHTHTHTHTHSIAWGNKQSMCNRGGIHKNGETMGHARVHNTHARDTMKATLWNKP